MWQRCKRLHPPSIASSSLQWKKIIYSFLLECGRCACWGGTKKEWQLRGAPWQLLVKQSPGPVLLTAVDFNLILMENTDRFLVSGGGVKKWIDISVVKWTVMKDYFSLFAFHPSCSFCSELFTFSSFLSLPTFFFFFFFFFNSINKNQNWSCTMNQTNQYTNQLCNCSDDIFPQLIN